MNPFGFEIKFSNSFSCGFGHVTFPASTLFAYHKKFPFHYRIIKVLVPKPRSGLVNGYQE